MVDEPADPKSQAAAGLERRKNDHLDIVLSGRTSRPALGTGLNEVRFVHCALPEIDLDDVEIGTSFLGRALEAPLLISSMTGGPERAATINRNLAIAAEELGIALAVGSQRGAIEADLDAGLTASLRALAPSVPLLGNFGAVQLVNGFGLDEARRAVDMLEADALVLHLNPLQEAVQPEGNRNWRGVLVAIEALAARLPVPIVAKEVGFGISGPVAARLIEAGVSVIDVAGAGGTNWALVEAERPRNEALRVVGAAFETWGIPTGTAIREVRAACPQTVVVASGGIRDGVSVARALRLGADIAGQAAATLESALVSPEAVISHFGAVIEQLRLVLFCTGSKDLSELRRAPLLG